MLALLCLALGACATKTNTIDLSDGNPPPATMQPIVGQQVRLTLNDGTSMEFVVKKVDSEVLAGEEVLVPWSEIQSLEIQTDKSSGNWGILAGIAGAVVIGVLIGVAAQGAAASSLLGGG